MAKKKKSNNQPKIIVVILAILALAAVMVAVTSLKKDDVPTNTDGEESTATQTNAPTDTDAPDATTPPETKEETKAPETDPPAPPKFYNPLTGMECSEELSKQRPIGIMINNIREAIPQEGITYGDVIYECLAEGGITRLFMLVQDYADLPQVGSVRSTRDYYLDFAQNHNALFFHAGGSEKAYGEIASRKIDNFDGVRMNIPNTFYRDPWRQANMAYEHTLVITGEGMVNAINYRKADTSLKEGFVSPFNFSQEKLTLDGGDAPCVYLPFSAYQSPYLKYNANKGVYQRWQYNQPHEDKDGDQLAFTNILVLFCHHTGPLDTYGRIEVTTTGNGEGYYISGGKYVDIKYSKANEDAPIVLTKPDGTPLEMNVGKTYVAIFNPANKANINMSYNK